MADEVTTETPTKTEEQTPALDPRESPAFKAVIKQLEDTRAELAKIKSAEEEAKSKAEKERLKAAEDWVALEERYKSEAQKAAEAAAAETARLQGLIERERNNASLAGAGVSDSVHREFLLDAYNKAEDKKDSFDAWIEHARTIESFKLFFGEVDRSKLPAGPGGAAAGRSGGKFTREDLRSSDPETRAAAVKWYENFVNKSGKKPW